MSIVWMSLITSMWALVPGLSSPDNVRINEFMASNIHAQLNPEYSDFDDWIELYNSGDSPADIGGLFFTDGIIRCRSRCSHPHYP